jgi:hypothetical protein
MAQFTLEVNKVNTMSLSKKIHLSIFSINDAQGAQAGYPAIGRCQNDLAPRLQLRKSVEHIGNIEKDVNDFLSGVWGVLRMSTEPRASIMSETSGRPLGSSKWLDVLEAKSGRVLKAQKRGPKAQRA